MRRVLLGLCLSAVMVFGSGCGGSGGGTGGTQPAVGNPVPAVTAVSPSGVTAGAASQMITVTGTGFVGASTILFNGASLSTTYVSATSLQA